MRHDVRVYAVRGLEGRWFEDSSGQKYKVLRAGTSCPKMSMDNSSRYDIEFKVRYIGGRMVTKKLSEVARDLTARRPLRKD